VTARMAFQIEMNILIVSFETGIIEERLSTSISLTSDLGLF
jgi:hypothetical protein